MANMFRCVLASGGALILTVTCDADFAGLIITATDGTTTLTQPCPSSLPYDVEFRLPNAGQWTISGVISGETQSITVDIPDNVVLRHVPNGSTVTPTDDIQTWLHCANIWDKNYTSVSQVLSDASTLQALIASNNAVDYMARSTTWASDVTANSSAMSYIGLNNYCADSLLADSTWLNAICNSTYFESVLNVKVPTMTSNTTPSGECIAKTYDKASYAIYKAFDNDSSTYWYSRWQQSPVGEYIGYKFPSSVKIYKMVYDTSTLTDDNYVPNQYKWQGTNDDGSWDSATWTDIATLTHAHARNVETKTKANASAFKSQRLYFVTTYSSEQIGATQIQFYGRASS